VQAKAAHSLFETCPKCSYERKPADSGDPGICGGCGLVFAKWVQRQPGASVRSPLPVDEEEGEAPASFATRVWNSVWHVPERTDPIVFWCRVALYVAFFVWGWYFILLDFRTNEIGRSFLHTINLVFHEAGHIVFMPFGSFMGTLGGTLGQILMPVVVMIALLWKNDDNFGASLGLWWTGQNFMDAAPYINDARDQQLMLIGGVTGQDKPGIHDWENILLDLRILEYDRQVAVASDALGTIIVLLALSWGGYLLHRQYGNLASSGTWNT